MASVTNKNIEFLSNRELIKILRSILDEIDIVASNGAHRSTTYLAVSAIEGLCGELLKLLRIQPNHLISGEWPRNQNGKNKRREEFTLAEMLKVLRATENLPKKFETLYDEPLRVYRNFIHPAREHKELRHRTPIAQSVGQLSLAGLNALIEMYESQRFVAGQKWLLMHGEALVTADQTINMPQKPGEFISLLVSSKPAEDIKAMSFHVIVPPDSIFNFIYSYFSLDQFMGARIEGRVNQNGKGFDNGLLHCAKWRNWSINGRYTSESEPNPRIQEHVVSIVFERSGSLAISVDQVSLELEGGVDWRFDPKGKIGFMTEWGTVSIVDLDIQVR